jgi:hypothetical protein
MKPQQASGKPDVDLQQELSGGQQNSGWIELVPPQMPPEPARHSHLQVEALKTSGGVQVTHCPVELQKFEPPAQAHRPVLASQKPLQHSEFSRQIVPTFRHRPGGWVP